MEFSIAGIVGSGEVDKGLVPPASWEKRKSFWMRRIPGHGTTLYYASGKLLIRGSKSVASALDDVGEAARELGTCVRNFEVKNIVFTADLGHRVDLEAAYSALSEAVYDPESFPGLMWKREGSETALVFASGKIVITGVRDSSMASRVALDLVQRLESIGD